MMSNNADTVKIIDTRTSGLVTIPNVVLETAGGNRINLPYTWEQLDLIDKVNEQNNRR